MNFPLTFLNETKLIADSIDIGAIEALAVILAETEGRLFIIGVGGSAANASHAVNDFRKICGIEAYAPTDNVSELTARTNDDGWSTTFEEWLKGSHLGEKDTLLVLSVGGGTVVWVDEETNCAISPNITNAVLYAKMVGSKIIGIVGCPNGCTARHANACVVIPCVNSAHVTPHTEAWQGIILHLLVSHPIWRSQ